MKILKRVVLTFILILGVISISSCSKEKTDDNKYSLESNWAYLEKDKENMDSDCFFITPLSYYGDKYNMPLDDEEAKKDFLGLINMEKGIYDDNCRFFAPYYSQISEKGYKLGVTKREPYLQKAYQDVKEAFLYYLENYNNGRPIVLAGFSQGADMSYRLLKDVFSDENINKLLVASYSIGWAITSDELDMNPHMKFAKGELDTGCIISFECEAVDVEKSFVIPEDVKALSINPLNWKTTSEKASKDLNKGYVLISRSNSEKINAEIANLCGCYIDNQRGALKVTDIKAQDYPPKIDLFSEGEYHVYDYMFFYRNLEENVLKRIEAYKNTNK